jgi:hypothetical protein
LEETEQISTLQRHQEKYLGIQTNQMLNIYTGCNVYLLTGFGASSCVIKEAFLSSAFGSTCNGKEEKDERLKSKNKA